jgi:hypothetical protein
MVGGSGHRIGARNSQLAPTVQSGKLFNRSGFITLTEFDE